jgi:hypothetical protein
MPPMAEPRAGDAAAGAGAGHAGGLIAELAERDATGQVQEIYTAIRELCGVPMVALIWRHLATLPDALPWAWELMGPALSDGRIQRAAWSIADAAAVPVLPAIPRAALHALGLDDRAVAGIASVLEAYNRANPANIVALSCIAHHLRAIQSPVAAVPDAEDRQRWKPPVALPALPPMVDPRAMSHDVRSLAALLSDRDPARPSPILPSLWRHLAPWPPMLAIAALLVPARFADVDSAATRVLVAARQAGEEIAGTLRPPTGGTARTAPFAQAVGRAIDGFSPRIPEMVVIGTMLRRAWPAPGAPAAVPAGASTQS